MTPDVIMTLVSYFWGRPGVARKARKQYSDVIITELFLRSRRSWPKGAFTRTLQGFPIKVTICRKNVTPLFADAARQRTRWHVYLQLQNVLGTWQTYRRPLLIYIYIYISGA